MFANEICPVCGEGTLIPHHRAQKIQRNGTDVLIEGVSYSVCSSCEADVVTPAQSRHNKGLVRRAEKRALGLLTGAEIRAIRLKLGLTQAQAADLFGGGQNAFSKYENEEVT